MTEAIGLGHDLGHPPFAHIGEEVLDACLRERFGEGFLRHNEHSLRVVEHLERDGAGLNLTAQVREGIVGHSSRAPLPQTLEGRIVRIMDRVAYINHDIDDALRAGVLTVHDLPREPIAVLGSGGSARIDSLVHDMVEHSQREGDIVQGAQAGAAMLALREFMFERVYLSPPVSSERARIERVVRRLFEHYVAHPELVGLRASGPPPSELRACAGGHGLHRGHDRSLLHRCVHGARSAARVRTLALRAVSTYASDARDRVREAVDFVELVSTRTELRGAGPNRYVGLCPFHEERTPSFGIDPVQKLYHCFGCGASGDVFTFVQETEGVEFKGALELLADRYGVELEPAREDPRVRRSEA